MAYLEALPEDVDGKKLFAALTDVSGDNVFQAIRGVNLVTQNGEVVTDLAVFITNNVIFVDDALSRFDDNAGHTDQIITVGETHVHIGALDAATTHVLISVEDAEIRYRTDGTDPTASIGHRLEPRNTMVWTAQRAGRASFIRGYTALRDATLHVTELVEVGALTFTAGA
jgi:hypothetical protein